MTDKELKKLNRSELLELMLEQSREIDRLQAELEETREALQERNLKIESCGSIAEAAAEVNSLFHAAQRAADMYLLNVQRICAEKAEAAGKKEEWNAAFQSLDPSGHAFKEIPPGEAAGNAAPEAEADKTVEYLTEEEGKVE